MTDAALRATIMQRALESRAPGRPVDALPPSTPLDAFRSAADQLLETLRSLGPDDWQAHAHDDIGTVLDLVAHLVGVQRLVLEWVSTPDGITSPPSEHLIATKAAIGDLEHCHPIAVTAAFTAVTDQVIAACSAADPAKPVLAHNLPTDVQGLLVLQAFELWAHLLDVCAATRRPAPAVDEPRLALMSSRLMAGVQGALALRRAVVAAPHIRFVLTGQGGGCYDVALSSDASTDDAITIVIDTVDVCRLAARRLPSREVDATIEGDEADANVVLGALDAFARD